MIRDWSSIEEQWRANCFGILQRCFRRMPTSNFSFLHTWIKFCISMIRKLSFILHELQLCLDYFFSLIDMLAICCRTNMQLDKMFASSHQVLKPVVTFCESKSCGCFLLSTRPQCCTPTGLCFLAHSVAFQIVNVAASTAWVFYPLQSYFGNDETAFWPNFDCAIFTAGC